MALVSTVACTTAMGHIAGANRHEASPFPPRLDAYLTDDHPVRFIEAFVDALDLEARGFRHAVAAATGRPRDHPGARLQLSIDGYLDRLRSSRRLEQETQRHVALRGLLKKLRPDHHTIAHCRRDHFEALRDVCRALTLLCTQRALFGGELVAIDGSKLSAVNAKGRHVPNATREQVSAPIDARVAGDLKALEAADAQDEAGPPGGARAAARQPTIEALRGRRRRDADLQAAWERSGQAQLSLTAPDRGALQGGTGGGTAVCDNVQTAVEATHKRIVACAVTTDPTDRDWLRPVAAEATAVLGGPCDAGADGGSDHGPDVQPGRQAGMTPYLARPSTSATQQRGLFRQADFTDAAATDTSRCPAGERLRCRCDTVARGRHMRY
jgi:transposase